MKRYWKVLNGFFLTFLFLLPLKFTQSICLPAVPATWPSDFSTLLYFPWSTYSFCLLSTVFLLLYLFADLAVKKGTTVRNVPLMCLAFLTAFSFLGWIRASCQVYVTETLIYMMGMLAFAMALHLSLTHTPEMKTHCLYSVACSAFFAALIGWDQHFLSLQMTREFVEQNRLSGQLSESMLKQLNSPRIFGPFQVCNTYAGYLAATMPIALYCVHLVIRNRCRTVKWSSYLHTFALAFAFSFLAGPLWLTGSRGALLALFAGGALVLPFCIKSRKKRFAMLGVYCFAGFAFLGYMIFFFRSPLSVRFRLDYDWAGLRMMGNNLFCGAGWGEFFLQYPQMKCLFNDETPHSPHNILLFFGSQAGAFAFLAALCLIAAPVVERFRGLWRENASGQSGSFELTQGKVVFLSFFVLAIDLLFEMGVENPACFATFLLFATLVSISCEEQGKPLFPKTGHPVWRLSWALPFCLCVLFLSIRELLRERDYSEFYEKVNPLTLQIQSPDSVNRSRGMLIVPESCRNNPYACSAMAWHLMKQRDFLNALPWMNRAIELCPGDSSLYRQRMWIHCHLTDTVSAERDFATLKKLEPHNPKLPVLFK